jgi:hypothetical protein
MSPAPREEYTDMRTATAAATRYAIAKNGPRECEKESPTGRIYTCMVTTCGRLGLDALRLADNVIADIAVDVTTCSLVSEHDTRREALDALAILEGGQS